MRSGNRGIARRPARHGSDPRCHAVTLAACAAVLLAGCTGGGTKPPDIAAHKASMATGMDLAIDFCDDFR